MLVWFSSMLLDSEKVQGNYLLMVIIFKHEVLKCRWSLNLNIICDFSQMN